MCHLRHQKNRYNSCAVSKTQDKHIAYATINARTLFSGYRDSNINRSMLWLIRPQIPLTCSNFSFQLMVRQVRINLIPDAGVDTSEIRMFYDLFHFDHMINSFVFSLFNTLISVWISFSVAALSTVCLRRWSWLFEIFIWRRNSFL